MPATIDIKHYIKTTCDRIRFQETENGTGPILKTDEGDGTISILKDAILEQLHRIGPVPRSLPQSAVDIFTDTHPSAVLSGDVTGKIGHADHVKAFNTGDAGLSGRSP